MSPVEIIASLVQIVLEFLPKDDPCPLCAARDKDPIGVTIAVDAANAIADAAEAAKFGSK